MDRCKRKLGDGPQIAIKRFWRLSWPDPLEFTFRLFFTILKGRKKKTNEMGSQVKNCTSHRKSLGVLYDKGINLYHDLNPYRILLFDKACRQF
ncbi:hypothetical protein HID58_081686 [Brassica napus]|uniref:Uncharacterized protein n=1 Tax=Brassica napus TaxID=3708 RepID=A0ABQ7Y8G3_BRANA|nr:hypothetical protein HID58_081686 [Brassica napus]